MHVDNPLFLDEDNTLPLIVDSAYRTDESLFA